MSEVDRSVLVVEDDVRVRYSFVAALSEARWRVFNAGNGVDALTMLGYGERFDALLLDLVLPDMDGFTILDRAGEQGLALPPVIVVSGFLDPKEWRRWLFLNVQILLKKPVSPDVLPPLLEAFYRRDDRALENVPGLPLRWWRLGGNRRYIGHDVGQDGAEILDAAEKGTMSQEVLNGKVREREGALIAEFKTRAGRDHILGVSEPLLVVGRRWNSWYPSFYDVEGGAYAVIAARAADGRTPAGLIDPGFKALRALERLNLPLGALDTCIITHNHPDHIGGVFEYVCGRHVLGAPTRVFCAPPVLEMFRSYGGGKVDIKAFDRNDVDLVPPYDAEDGRRLIVATPLETSHDGIGQLEGARGIILSSRAMLAPGAPLSKGAALILGDTEYSSYLHHPNSLFEHMRHALKNPDLRVVVLHIGSSQLKAGTGKHLYLNGVLDVLWDLSYWRRTAMPSADPLLVLISEWGLEHASAAQLRRVSATVPLPPGRTPAGDRPLILDTCESLEPWRFPGLRILPADIGLTVGIESGKVYLRGSTVSPDDVSVGWDEEGLTYGLKVAATGAP